MSRRYLPDIFVEYMNGEKSLVEVKPNELLKDSRVKAKIDAAILFCKSQGFSFEVWTQDRIFGGVL
jgi:hypothetical protein